jgi:hypothetical protein
MSLAAWPTVSSPPSTRSSAPASSATTGTETHPAPEVRETPTAPSATIKNGDHLPRRRGIHVASGQRVKQTAPPASMHRWQTSSRPATAPSPATVAASSNSNSASRRAPKRSYTPSRNCRRLSPGSRPGGRSAQGSKRRPAPVLWNQKSTGVSTAVVNRGRDWGLCGGCIGGHSGGSRAAIIPSAIKAPYCSGDQPRRSTSNSNSSGEL